MTEQRNEDSSSLGADSAAPVAIDLPVVTEVEEKLPRCKSKLYKDQQTKFVFMIPFILFCFFGSFIDMVTTNLALPIIQEDFQKSRSVCQWISTVSYIAQVGFSIPMAKLAEKVGVVPALAWFLAVQAVVEFGCFFCTNFYLYVFLKFVIGVTNAGGIPARTSIVRCLAPPAKAQTYIQQQTVLLNVVSILIPLIASAIIKAHWRYFHIVCAGCSLIAALFLIPIQSPKMPKTSFRFDIWGTALLFVGASAVDLSFTIASAQKWIAFALFLVIGLGCLVWLYFVEKKHEDPVLPLKLLRNPVIDYILINMIQYYIQNGVQYLIPQTLSFYEKDPMIAGAISMAVSVGGMIMSISVVFLTKKFLNKSLILVSGCIAVVLLVLSIVSVPRLPLFLLLVTFYQFTSSMTASIIFPMTLTSVPRRYAGQISAIPTTGRSLGQSMTLCISSMLLQTIYTGKQSSGAEPAQAWSFALRIEFIIYMALQLAMVVLTALRTGHSPNESGKKKFNAKKVRVIKGLETDIEQRDGLLQTPAKVEGEIE